MEQLEYDLLLRWFVGIGVDDAAWLYKKGKGKEANLHFMGHGLMENRHGFVVDALVTEADW